MNTERINVGGAVVMRELAKSTLRSDIEDGLRELCLSKYMPEKPTPLVCLRAVLPDVYPPPEKGVRHKIESARNGTSKGYAVFAGKVGDVHVGDEWGEAVVVARLDKKTGSLDLDPWDYEKHTDILERMRLLSGWISKATAGSILSKLAEEHCDATPLPAGGTHWIRDDHLDTWREIVEVFERATVGKDGGDNRIHTFSVVPDESMLRAVTDALIRDVTLQLRDIERELAEGNLKEEACLARLARVGELERKTKRYEEAYSLPLGVLQDALQRTSAATAQAALLASASQQAARQAV